LEQWSDKRGVKSGQRQEEVVSKQTSKSWIAEGSMKDGSQILRMKPEWAWLAFIDNPIIGCDQICDQTHALRPSWKEVAIVKT
jgi:hypothetical protein